MVPDMDNGGQKCRGCDEIERQNLGGLIAATLYAHTRFHTTLEMEWWLSPRHNIV